MDSYERMKAMPEYKEAVRRRWISFGLTAVVVLLLLTGALLLGSSWVDKNSAKTESAAGIKQ